MNTYPISNTNKELLARLHSLASSLMAILPISATVASTINDFTAYVQKGAF